MLAKQRARLSLLACLVVPAALAVSLPAQANQPPVTAWDEVMIPAGVGGGYVYPLDNDYDPDNDTLTLVSFTQPGWGEVYRYGDQLVYYVPCSFYGCGCGIFPSFNYTVTDGHGAFKEEIVFVRMCE